MSRRTSLTWLCLLFCAGTCRSDVPPDASKIVTEVQKTLRPDRSFAVTTESVTTKKGVATAAVIVRSFVNVPTNGSSPASLSITMSPPSERGKVFLRTSSGMLWFYDPRAKRPVRISAQQMLRGQAVMDDMLRVNLTADYQATVEQQDETITDRDGKLQTAARLRLTAKSKSAPYPALLLWLEKGSLNPIMMQGLAASGKKLKTVSFSDFRGWLGNTRPTRFSVIDELSPGSETVIKVSDFEHRQLPPEQFSDSSMTGAQSLISN